MDVLNELIMLSASQEGFAVGDQKVCIRSNLKIKYKKQTFWNTNSGGKKISDEADKSWPGSDNLIDENLNIMFINVMLLQAKHIVP